MHFYLIIGYSKSLLKYSDSRLLGLPEIQSLLPRDNNLVLAAYSTSSWNSMASSMKALQNFELSSNLRESWPLSVSFLCKFVEWCFYTKKLQSSTIKSYLSNISTLHKLNGLSIMSFADFLVKTCLKGVENLHLCEPPHKRVRKPITLPLLKMLLLV